MLTESQITRTVTTPNGTKHYRDQETRDIVDSHTPLIQSLDNDVDELKAALGYPEITYFGWRHALNDSNPEGEPVGNLVRLQRMQQILQLGGYMVKNDHTRRKLSPSNHNFYADDGSQVDFTGADGHYQWGWGVDLYYASWTEDGYEYEVFDTSRILGKPCVKIPVGSVCAPGRCAIDRTNLILVSYVSDDPKYRGADNDDTHDSDYLCQLGKPVTNLPIADLAAYARKNGSRWMANERVAIFVVGALMRVYFHNGSIQVPFDPNPDANGLHRGGLGMGIDCESGSWWSGYNGYRPYWKQNVGIEKGDFTGLLSTTIELSDGTTQNIGNIPCFMGLKNWYKSLYVMEEDSLLICNANKTQSMYVKKVIDGTAPSLDSTTGLQLVGSTPAHESGSWSYIKRFSKAYLSGMPTLDGGTEDTFYGDGYYNPAVTDGSVRGCDRLASAGDGSLAGSLYLHGNGAPSGYDVRWGAVLCEFTESFDTELTTVSA